ncbi:MAG: aminopeptidase [Deltaproteobacteria bacterium]|nr:aminopeptidase [Deltaproteobacteria bacterium]MBW2306332.1 aminopeptidase [Deltaproteobacteria bacterium]
MKQILMAKGARILAKQCASIKPGEKVLIITDFLKTGIAEVIAAAVYELGAEVVMTVIAPTKIDGAEPPDAVAMAMKEVDCVIMPVTKSLAHSNAARTAIQEGARVISMAAFTEDQMIKGGLFADFRKEKPTCDKVAQLLTEAKTIHLITEAGTDLTFSVEGRKGNSHCCIVDSPGFTAVPNIEANLSPVEGTTNGVIVGDGSIPYYDIGVLTEPITFKVKDGFIYEITGGVQAEVISDLMAAQNDKYVYNIAQFAVGLNPMCTELTGVMLNDEGVLGTIHIGIGTSSNIGGQTKAATHFDVLIRKPTVTFDGKLIMEKGELRI